MLRLPQTTTSALKSSICSMLPLASVQSAPFAAKNNPNSPDYIPPNVGSHRKIYNLIHHNDFRKKRSMARSRYTTPIGDEFSPFFSKTEVRLLKKNERDPSSDPHAFEKRRGTPKSRSGVMSPDAKYLLRSLAKRASDSELKLTRREKDLDAKYSHFETERKAIDTLISRGYTEKLILDGSHLVSDYSGKSYDIKHAKLAEIHRIEDEEEDEETGYALVGIKIFNKEGGGVICQGIMEVSNEELRDEDMRHFVDYITSMETASLRR
eukprot:TRINITY_DN901_c0_g2_i1.p1 TRINITY_DN901_c0_g2~~TRINITY_DN901_c0_g2_i1.p1  ORF type:complete len:273 (-),score=100.81 TRINITY_DN901_c0_g2_i1:63-860(-)